MGNAWWIINNLSCGIEMNIESICYNNFTQIAKIEPFKRLSINVTKFTFGTNLFIKQHVSICDFQTPINLN